MDELDEQLKQFSVSNRLFNGVNKETVDGNHLNVKFVNNVEKQKNVLQKYQAAITPRLIDSDDFMLSSKKLGPSVPPKPQKKSSNVPEVPQSSLVRKACEPLYAKRLQSVDLGNYDSEVSKLPVLLRKQSSYADVDSVANASSIKNRRKVTLDNPAILEQQLEALEHHKKQLEKREKLNNKLSNNSKLNTLNAPKLSTSSLLTDLRFTKGNFVGKDDETYANDTLKTSTNSKSTIYGNVMSTSSTALNNIYSNISYDTDKEKESFSKKKGIFEQQIPEATSLTNENKSVYFTRDGSMVPEEEMQSPPSPVSSSYSELRRATEIFKENDMSQNIPTIADNDDINVSKSFVGYETPRDNKVMIASNDIRKFYVNKLPYTTNDAFNNFKTDMQTKTNTTLSDYYAYGGFSQNSSTYESIYEPINPRPHSQLSTRSNHLMYPTSINNSNISSMPECTDLLTKSKSSNLSTLSGLSVSSSIGSNSPLYPNMGICSESSGTFIMYPQNTKKLKEESLTDFLDKSIDTQQDVENYGICFNCNEIVVGENSGCTAMDQIYHISCFTCSQCQINLQGKPFYALECKPFCEFDYLQTLEKCSVCANPILERILRATGKPYHPQCFTCVICRKSLDGIPFTVDATNQNYCIEDFHKKFAPRCCVCKDPIMPEPGEEETVRVVALDRSFHFECYKCEDCGLLLSSEAEGRGCYPLDDHVLCKSCNAKRVQMLTNCITTIEISEPRV